MGFKQKICSHLQQIPKVKSFTSYECEACVKIGGTWLHLRKCQSCGVTLCCDSSPNKYARKHARREEHNVISSAEPGEKWMYCYKDDLMIPYL